jgi:hypothetical protein
MGMRLLLLLVVVVVRCRRLHHRVLWRWVVLVVVD